MPNGRSWLSVPLLIVALMLPATVKAEEVNDASFPSQIFEPAIGLDSYFSVEGPGVSEHLGFTVGLMFNYQYQPVVLRITKMKDASAGVLAKEEIRIGLVDHALTADVLASFAVRFRWFKA